MSLTKAALTELFDNYNNINMTTVEEFMDFLFATPTGSFVPYTGATTNVALATKSFSTTTGTISTTSGKIYTTSGSISVGRNNPDRPLEVFSSTGIASMQAYSTASNSLAGVYAQADNTTYYSSLVHFGSTFPTNGLRTANAAFLDLTSPKSVVLNPVANADLIFAAGGFQTINEGFRLHGNFAGVAQRTNAGFFGGASFGSGLGVINIANAATVPSANPVGGGLLYCEAGALKYRGTGGTITVLGPA